MYLIYQHSAAPGSRHLSRLPARLPLYIHTPRWTPPPALHEAQQKQELQSFQLLALIQAISTVAQAQGRSANEQLQAWGLG